MRQSNILSPDVWQGIERDVPRKGRPVYGVDLGGEAASSAIAAYWPESGRLECVAAFAGKPSPGGASTERRSRRPLLHWRPPAASY